jgi:hypothetical protein
MHIEGDQKSSCAPYDYSTKTSKNMMAITEHIRNADRAVLNTVLENTVRVVSNVWRLAGTLNITCNFLYCNNQVHRDFLIAL